MRAARVSVQTIASEFIDAFNRRDAEGLLALMDPAIEFHPTGLVGTRRRYDGHDGVRCWLGELESSPMRHQVRVREVRRTEDSKIVEARAFLSNAEMLAHLGLIDSGEAR